MAGSGKLHPVAAFFLYGLLGLVVISFMVVSGIANVSVWWNSASGWTQYVFASIGIGAEIWGALGLVVLTRRFVQRHWLKGLVALALWLPAVGFNGYSSYRFFILEGAAIQGEATTTRTALQIANDRIEEITTELATIDEVRASEAIRAERDALPENYRTRRAELSAELGQAERKEALESELAEQRQTKLDNATAQNAPESKGMTDGKIIAALVIWMEAVKALALWVIAGRVEAPQNAPQNAKKEKRAPRPRNRENAAPEAPEADNVHILEPERKAVRYL